MFRCCIDQNYHAATIVHGTHIVHVLHYNPPARDHQVCACGVRLDMESRRGGVKKIIDLLVVDLQKRTLAEKLHKITKLCVCVRKREILEGHILELFISNQPCT